MTEVVASRPRYAELAAELAAEIGAGVYPVGGPLPTEAKLRERYQVSRSTIRQALGMIVDAGLIERTQGSGSKVIARTAPVRYVLSVSTDADILRYAEATTFEFITNATRASSEDARRLGLGDPGRWTSQVGVRRDQAQGPPIALTTVFLPTRFVDTVQKRRGPRRTAIFEALANEHDLTLSRIEHEMTASLLTPEEADVLHAEAHAPALVIVRRYLTVEQGCVEVSESLHPADRFTYTFRLERESNRIPFAG